MNADKHGWVDGKAKILMEKAEISMAPAKILTEKVEDPYRKPKILMVLRNLGRENRKGLRNTARGSRRGSWGMCKKGLFLRRGS